MRYLVLVPLGIAVLLLSASSSAASAMLPQVGLTGTQRARAENMLRDRLPCLGCHRLGDEGGGIGPPLDGLADRMTRAQALDMIRDPAGTVPGTLMPRQRMPERDARLLVAYLFDGRDDPPSQPVVAPRARPDLPADQRTDGAALYARHCAACHGDGGGADGWNAPALPVRPTAHADAALMSRRPDDTLFDGIAAGAYMLGGSPRMPAFGEMLDAEQIRALVAYIRALCGCVQPDWADGPGP